MIFRFDILDLCIYTFVAMVTGVAITIMIANQAARIWLHRRNNR